MDFVCDVHIAKKVVSELKRLGFDAVHANDLMGTDAAKDEMIGEASDRLGAGIITKDKLFRKRNEQRRKVYVPQRIITVDDMNSRANQIRFMLRRHQDSLELLVKKNEPYSYLLDRFGGFHLTDDY